VETSIADKTGLTKEQFAVLKQHVEETTPLKRFGTPEEMAKTMLFIATDATYMTG
jgi:NAD(P)-dependent dehydrogenase (short-subunit alcohol dehydrogenase family)